MNKVQATIRNAGLVEAKSGGDTIRLWESHREQALLWRAIALLQIPATIISIVFAIVMWSTRSIELNVPARPLPGHYTAQEIPDSEFVDFATNYLNLIATYQPAVARRQYNEARKMLWEPMLVKFDEEMMGTELKTIETTNRTQIFFADPVKTEIRRDGRLVEVTIFGDRSKMIAGKEMPVVETKFTINMTTIPKNSLNPYGIVIMNVESETVKR